MREVTGNVRVATWRAASFSSRHVAEKWPEDGTCGEADGAARSVAPSAAPSGLSTVHNSPRSARWGVQVWEGASLVELDTDIHGALRVAGGKRGKISGFSPASRRRLLRKLAKTRCDCLPHFVTLTYPDRFPRDAQRWKRDLDALLKRLRRLFPASAGVWKLEVKERQSGDSAGAIAPHFHVLLWGVPESWEDRSG